MDASELGQVNKICLLESASVWYPIAVKHPSVLKAVSGTPTLRYASTRPGADDITAGRYYPGKNGACLFLAPGIWYLNIPLAATSAAIVCFYIYDCGSPENAQAMFTQLSLGADVNLTKIGGTDQTGADAIKPLFGAITADDSGAVTVGVVSSALVAARAGRTKMTCRNISTGSERICLSFAVAGAVIDSGIVLDPGDAYTWNWPNCPTAALNGIASAATALLSYAQYYRV